MSRPRSALIVDDESHVRVYLRMMLRQLGVERIMEASDGAHAIEIFKSEHPGVVLLDIVMPGQTGQSVLADLRSIDPNVAVIVVTSQDAQKTVQEIHAMGALCYILKHTPRDQILKMLAETLDSVEPSQRGKGEPA